MKQDLCTKTSGSEWECVLIRSMSKSFFFFWMNSLRLSVVSISLLYKVFFFYSSCSALSYWTEYWLKHPSLSVSGIKAIIISSIIWGFWGKMKQRMCCFLIVALQIISWIHVSTRSLTSHVVVPQQGLLFIYINTAAPFILFTSFLPENLFLCQSLAFPP